ncbi:MAG: 3-isopropylmalate dehydratase small subunit [Candidatus Goldbacteria bacterium]|nr:3-isopropylmalate dehydratase small subunit [Candidatus Goldiibacteriota bacterium]
MIKGRVWKFGDDVDTDAIIPARYLNTSDPKELAAHVMEDADKDFSKKVKNGDIIVAGKNFGCGSSREHAPLAIKSAGISCVIARDFARIFYRNSFNIGLLIFESKEASKETEQGDELEIFPEEGLIKNLTKSKEYKVKPIPDFMQELIKTGGLMNYAKKFLKTRSTK